MSAYKLVNGPWQIAVDHARDMPCAESRINKDSKSLRFLNLKYQNFSKISKFQKFSGN